jgi:transposase-like protein
MEASRRRSITDDYKQQAVELVASSGRSIDSAAKELGLRDSVLRRWVQQRGVRRGPTAAARPTAQATCPLIRRRFTSSSSTISVVTMERPSGAPFAPAGAKLFFLPPYSPDLNPIEQAFAKLKPCSERPPSLRGSNLETQRTLLAYFTPSR